MKPIVRISVFERVRAPGHGLEEMIRLGLWNHLGCPQGDVRVAWVDLTNGDLCMTAYDNPNAEAHGRRGSDVP